MAESTASAGTGSGQGAGSVSAAGGQFLPPREVMIVLPGLLMAILLAMLDNLIVSTALPRIVGDLGGVAHLSRRRHANRPTETEIADEPGL